MYPLTAPTAQNYPLFATGPPGNNGVVPKVYKPLHSADLVLIKEKLPPLSQGGEPWYTALRAQTSHMTLALGDVRRLITDCSSALSCDQLFGDMGLDEQPIETELGPHAETILRALQNRFPLTTPTPPTLTPYVTGQCPNGYMELCIQAYIKSMHSHPLRQGPTTCLFFAAGTGRVASSYSDCSEKCPRPYWQL